VGKHNPSDDKFQYVLLGAASVVGAIAIGYLTYCYYTRDDTEETSFSSSKAQSSSPHKDKLKDAIDRYLTHTKQDLLPIPGLHGHMLPSGLDQVDVLFARSDLDHDGKITRAELKSLLEHIVHDFRGLHPHLVGGRVAKDVDEVVQDAFLHFDKDENGVLDKQEFRQYAHTFLADLFHVPNIHAH